MSRQRTARNSIKNWNVALYIRLSREDGNEVSLSIGNQTEMLEKYVSNSEENFIIYDRYIDDGKTGTDSDRPNFQRMLNDINDKKVNCVIVKDTSRLSRNYAEAGLYMEQVFVEKKVRFISLSLPTLDSYLRPEEISSIATAMQNVINDDFCRQTSLKVRGVLNVKRSKGLFVGAFAPYGYMKNPGNIYHLIIDENVANNIRNIFKWFILGESKNKITFKLNNLGILNPTSYKKSQGENYCNPHDRFETQLWSTRTISTILQNQMYIGDMVQGKGKVVSYKIHKQIAVPKDEWFIVENTHEPIIDKQVFYKAQELLKRDIKTVNKKNEVNLFSGLLKCADCKKAMHITKNGKYVYYMCKTYKTQSKTFCTRHSIKEQEIIVAVLNTIKVQIALVENFESLIKKIEKASTTKNIIETLINAIKKKGDDFNRVNRIRDNLYRDWKNDDITREDYFRLRQSYDTQLTSLKESLDDLNNQLTTMKSGVKSGNPYFEYFKKYKNIDYLERGLLLELIENIYIKENKEIDIVFKFQDQQKQILMLIESMNKND